MTSPALPHRARGLFWLHGLGLFTLVLIAIGCAHRQPPPGEGPGRAGPPQPTLSGEASFFDGALVVSALVRAPQPGPPSGPGPDTDGKERPGGGGGPGGGPPPGLGGARRPGAGGDDGRPGVMMASLPIRQELVVRIRNVGPAPVKLRVREVKSILGNFVPEPETFVLGPDQEQTLQTMRSCLDSLGRLDLSIALESGKIRELQIIALHPAGPSGRAPSP